MGQTIHVCLDIRGAIRNRSYQGFTNDDGSEASESEVEFFLLDELLKGRKVLPMTNPPCDGFCYQTGCPGHENNK